MTTPHKIVLRKELENCKRLVIKVGSNVVTKANGRCDVRKMRIIVEDICDLIDEGFEIILVSSGAVSVGKAFLKRMLPREGRVDLQQSASAIGQPKLINKYSQLFEDHHHICSQILLTHDDFRKRKRFLHAKQTIEVLLKNHVTPILNENDSISYSENTVGDNDHLAASAAQMVNADALIIITSAQGLYDKNPIEKDAKLIKNVDFGEELDHIDMSATTNVGRGGMESKIHAVNKVTPLGIRAIISSKDNNRIVLDPLTKEIGTMFGHESNFEPEQKKAWLISTKKLNCRLEIDEGAFQALMAGNSLFPRGVVESHGEYFQGDCIDICYQGKPFAVGISEYDGADVERIKDKHSDEIEEVLGYKISSAVILYQNLVLLEETINE
ncbi:MAG: glutamate 5-kinase [Halobacteriovoraceae bacterium]|nr:glutamate 5-kinase [Halobacteriovoraceae bacterium]|tara:strand:- start:5994 stop:7145 length:1152 start_codon:yes stop_codon:yes gene_type:complete